MYIASNIQAIYITPKTTGKQYTCVCVYCIYMFIASNMHNTKDNGDAIYIYIVQHVYDFRCTYPHLHI